jgi:hypothetical protein
MFLIDIINKIATVKVADLGSRGKCASLLFQDQALPFTLGDLPV